MEKIKIKTNKRVELIDITEYVESLIKKTKVNSGVCLIFCPHTTAGLTINENADPAVTSDIISTLNKIIPFDAGYAHSEGNSDSHLKSSLFGASLSIFIENSKLTLGQWQGIYFCESDGPRQREAWVKVIESK